MARASERPQNRRRVFLIIIYEQMGGAKRDGTVEMNMKKHFIFLIGYARPQSGRSASASRTRARARAYSRVSNWILILINRQKARREAPPRCLPNSPNDADDETVFMGIQSTASHGLF